LRCKRKVQNILDADKEELRTAIFQQNNDIANKKTYQFAK